MLGQVRSGFQWVRLSTVSPIVISRTCAQNVALSANFETPCLQRSMDLEVIPLWIERINRASPLAHVFLVHNFDA